MCLPTSPTPVPHLPHRSLEALLPASPFETVPHRLGCLALLPGLLLVSKRTRHWFIANRDWMLFSTWAAVAGWMLLAQRSRPDPPSSHMLGALTLLALAFQMRFRFLAPLLLALNMQLLPTLCIRHLLHSVVPLSSCYCLEAHTRRLFLQQSWRP